jgi:hypothetical protein
MCRTCRLKARKGLEVRAKEGEHSECQKHVLGDTTLEARCWPLVLMYSAVTVPLNMMSMTCLRAQSSWFQGVRESEISLDKHDDRG